MAYTKIKNIKTTVNKAIDYIINPLKTNNGQFVFGYNVSPKTADIEFSFTEKMAETIKGDYKREDGNLAYHIIQSFEYNDIITPQEALEIGRKTVEELTEGKYEYVIATHIDKNHIHNHIIFNSVSHIDFKRFNSEPYKTIAKLRSVSDKFCMEKGLNILKPQKNDSKSYYEWTMEKQGISWKKTLKNIIDKNIIKAKSFEDFIDLMQQDNYTIKHGKYLAFKHNGQDRYIRAYKLGIDYSEEKIKERVLDKNKHKNYVKNISKHSKTLPLNVWLKIKARKQTIENIKGIAEMILNLEKQYNIRDKKDIQIQKGNASANYNEIKKNIITLEQKTKTLQEKQRNILIYLKYENINQDYQKSLNKKKFYNKFEGELILFESAEKNITNPNKEELEKDKIKNENEIKDLQNQIKKLYNDLKHEQQKITDIEKLDKQIQKISAKENEEQQRKQKKKNISL